MPVTDCTITLVLNVEAPSGATDINQGLAACMPKPQIINRTNIYRFGLMAS